MTKRKWTAQEVQDYVKTHHKYFYYNREDANVIVPKPLAFSFNWGHPTAMLIGLAILVLIILASF